MKLHNNVSLIAFLQTARQCSGEVCYKTNEGDVLNLKSQLSQYIFLAALSAGKESVMPDGVIVCELESDYEILKEFLSV